MTLRPAHDWECTWESGTAVGWRQMSEGAVNRLSSYSLLRLQIPVDDPQAVEVVQSQGQLSQVELDILLREHHLAGWERTVVQLILRLLGSKFSSWKPGLSQNACVEMLALR